MLPGLCVAVISIAAVAVVTGGVLTAAVVFSPALSPSEHQYKSNDDEYQQRVESRAISTYMQSSLGMM